MFEQSRKRWDKVFHVQMQAHVEEIQTACRMIKEQYGVSVTADMRHASIAGNTEYINVVFTAKDSSFTFWKWILAYPKGDKHRGVLTSHLVPPYHPAISPHKSYSINGATQALIEVPRNVSIEIIPPDEVCVMKKNYTLSSAWDYMCHPYRAECASFEMKMRKVTLNRIEIYDTIFGFLRAACGIDNNSVQVGGGFRVPLPSASMLLEKDAPVTHERTGRKVDYIRGTEHACVWEHRVLTQEGVLDDTYIPTWFVDGGWLDIYADQELQFR